jgi:integrase
VSTGSRRSPTASRRVRPRQAADDPAQSERLIGEWLRWVHAKGRRDRTVLTYASVLGRFLDDVVVSRPLSAVTLREVEAWLLRPRGGRAGGEVAQPITRAKDVHVVRGFYSWLRDRDEIDNNPMALLVAPSVVRRQPRAVADHIWLNAWSEAAAMDEPAATLVLGLGGLFGFRRAEIVAINADHFKLRPGLIVGFPRKGGGDDTFPWQQVLDVWDEELPQILGDCGTEPLRRRLAQAQLAGGPLLPGWNANKVSHRLRRRWLPAWGIGDDEGFTPHALRHTFITNLLRAGMPIEMVSELANHSDISTTMGYVKGGADRVGEWLRLRRLDNRDRQQASRAGRRTV